MARVQGFQKGLLFPHRVCLGPTLMGPRALHAMHTLLLLPLW